MDEYLHLDQAHHMDWGYVSIPPLTSWISYIIFLLGNSVFWVKFFPALFGVLTLVFVWEITKALKGKTFALILSALSIIFSDLLHINTLFQPNSFDILCWTVTFYWLLLYIRENKNKWLFAISLTLAIGFLNKYNIGFLIAGLLPAIALTKHRIIFKSESFYVAVILFMVIILPNIIWQLQHNFPVFTHMEELVSTQLIYYSRIEFLIKQLIEFAPAFFVIIFAFIGLIIYKPFILYRPILYTYIIVIILYLLLQGKAYYALGLYPVLISLGSVYIEHLTASKARYYFRYTAVSFIMIIGITFFFISCPIFSLDKMMSNKSLLSIYEATGQTTFNFGKQIPIQDDYASMTGWRELAELVNSIYSNLPEKVKNNTFIFCDNYGEAGAINYYLNPIPRAGSFHADYINWFPDDKHIVKSLIYVKRWNGECDMEMLSFPFLPFSNITYVGSVRNNISKEYNTSVYLLTESKNVFTIGDIKMFY